jgi:hypothetical protein
LQGRGKGGFYIEAIHYYDSGYGYGEGDDGYSGYGENATYAGDDGYSGYGENVTYAGDDGYSGYGENATYADNGGNATSAGDDDLPPPEERVPQECTQVPFEETFLFLSADLAIPPTTADPNEIGTNFIYDPSPIYNETEFSDNVFNAVELESSQITGVCTRTSSTLDGDVGGGDCQFVIVVDGSSVTFGGFIEDNVAGGSPQALVISGGSAENTGITGEVALIPVDGNGDEFTGDIFFDAFGYQATLSGIMLVCEMMEAL